MIQNSEFDELLRKSWSNRYEKERGLFRSTLKFTHLRQIENSPFKAYFNLQLIENKVSTQIRDPDTEIIRDFNQDEESFLQIEDGEILFYADIENSKVQLKENNPDADHPILLNTGPICSYHSLIVPFISQKLNQVLSGHISAVVVNLFKMSQSPSLRLGYNSILGNCSINQLHLHLIYTDQLFETKQFPIETFEILPYFEKETLIVGEVKNYPIRTIAIKGKSAIEFLSIALDCLLKNGIPHNILFVSPELVYIYPRKSQFDFIHDHTMKPAFIELSGLVVCRNKQFYDEVTMKEITDKYSSLSHPEFDVLVEEIKAVQEQE